MAITRNTVDVYRMSPAKWFGLAVLALFFLGGGVSHFLYTDGFTAIVPPWMPYPRETVLATGGLEWLFVALLFVKRARPIIGLWIAVYCLAVLPANVYMLQNNIPMFGHTFPRSFVCAHCTASWRDRTSTVGNQWESASGALWLVGVV